MMCLAVPVSVVALPGACGYGGPVHPSDDVQDTRRQCKISYFSVHHARGGYGRLASPSYPTGPRWKAATRRLAGLDYLPVHVANRPELGRDPVSVFVHRRPGT